LTDKHVSHIRGFRAVKASNRRASRAAGPAIAAALILALVACAGRDEAPGPGAAVDARPKDAEHAGITEPHGDHSPHRGGMVLMNGDVHYEVVLDPSGRHEVWFTDAVRVDLPAAVASNVRMRVSRPGAEVETLALAIDEAGESWVARGLPIAGEGVIVALTYDLKGAPLEIELPFVPAPR
jgi:hypothetical protein